MKTILKILFVVSLLLFYNLYNHLFAQNDFPEFEKQNFVAAGGIMPYRLLKPAAYDTNKKYPLVLFLHGAGERGTDNKITLTHIAPLFMKENNRKDYPCFVLVPQCPKELRWVEVHWGNDFHAIPEKASLPLSLVLELIDSLSVKYAIDKQKIYITGLSMGGYGTWDALARYPDKFAAAIPICGGGDEKTATLLREIPIWAFHGTLDKVVKPSRSRNMIAAIKQSGGNPKYTEYPNVQHDSWKPTYLEPDLLKWMFQQKKGN